MSRWWPWDVLIVLGAYHGLNPGMGWLFAVARGLQERRRSAVWQSFLPIALGHEAAIGVVIVLVAVAQFLFAPQALRIAGAVILFAFAGYRLWRRTAHPRGCGMRIGVRGLFGWAFLRSSALGAGLILVLIMLRLSLLGDGNEDMAVIAYATAFSPWHGHHNEDELFLFVNGRIHLKLRDGDVAFRQGEFAIVPRGVKHSTASDEDTLVLLLEYKSTVNTGEVRNERTVA